MVPELLQKRQLPRFTLALVGLALVLRLAAIVARGEYLPPRYVGAEAGVMAQGIVEGRGFVTPFGGDSPSTHLPPAYPLLLAGLQMLAGAGGDAAVHRLALLINLAASCALPVLAMRLSLAAGLPSRAARLAGLAMCVCPEALRAAGLVWDEALFATCVAAMLLWLVRRLAAAPLKFRHASGFGLASGILSLLNPAAVLALPVAFLAGAWQQGTSARRLAAMAGLLALATLLGGAPWHVRNFFVLDPPARVFVRGNFWLEVWSNLNRVQFTPAGPRVAHPWRENGRESLERDGRTLTEREYYAWCRERALASCAFASPLCLARHVATQADAFWIGRAEAARWRRNVPLFVLAQGLPAVLGVAGLVLARGRKGSATRAAIVAMAAVLLVLPLPYYLSGGGARYRHPLDVVLYVGIGAMLAAAIEWWRAEKPGGA